MKKTNKKHYKKALLFIKNELECIANDDFKGMVSNPAGIKNADGFKILLKNMDKILKEGSLKVDLNRM